MGRSAAFAIAVVLAVSGCMPADIRSVLPALSTAEPSYAGRWQAWLPWWYTLYSLVPGESGPECAGAPPLVTGTPPQRVTLAPCMPLPAPDLSALAADTGAVADAVEAAFAGRIRIDRIRLRLLPPGVRASARHTQWLDRRGLVLDFVAPYDARDPDGARRAIARSAAHELFHMAKRVLSPWHALEHANPPEEAAAALFESCVEDAVFHSISRSAMDPSKQSDPRVLSGQPDAYRSAAGNLRATGRLAEIAGSDGAIDGAGERDRLKALCASLAP
jgi:hypothetical protein